MIPSRNEIFLQQTIKDALANMRGDTEIIVVLDGWECELEEHKSVRVIHHEQSIGQRAATNEAARLSSAHYLMKLDAHCAFDQGFDIKLMQDMQPDWTVVPIMRNLHAFDWVCPKGHRRYQSPSGPCADCGEPTTMDIRWIGKTNPQSTSYCFDQEPHFQYFNAFKKRPRGKGNITESMSLQGSCFMVTAEKYWELELCDESFGSWGSQGIEVAVKTWLSGGSVMCNQKTWYAHMFRTQGADFGFPYPQSGHQVAAAKKTAKELFFNDNWPKQVRPLSWLLDRFKPIPGWHYAEKRVTHDSAITEKVIESGKEFNRVHGIITDKKPTVGLVYYSDGHAPQNILKAVQGQIKNCSNGHDIVSVTLVPMDFGRNTLLKKERGYQTMFEQILMGVQQSKADVLFLVEHDVYYSPSHFEFTPPQKDIFYYDENKWHVRVEDGHALFYHHMSTSMLCAYRELLLKHYEARVEKVRKEGFTRYFGFEPGSHKRPRGCDDYTREPYFAKFPSLDLRHKKNLTPNRWRKDQFRNQRQLWAWKEDKVWNLPGWDKDVLKQVISAIP